MQTQATSDNAELDRLLSRPVLDASNPLIRDHFRRLFSAGYEQDGEIPPHLPEDDLTLFIEGSNKFITQG